MTVDSQVILSATQSIPLLHFYHSVLPPLKRAYSEHKHTAFEISCILSGSGLYKTQNALYHFHAGDIFYTAPMRSIISSRFSTTATS